MNVFVNEYKRYKDLLEKTIEQVLEEDFFKIIGDQGNSIAIILKHVSGNLISRFTDFLTSDGEKDWRDRDSEFDTEKLSKTDLMEMWNKAWSILETAVFNLNPGDMNKSVIIRGVQFSVEEALARSLTHFSYHVGQIVFLGKLLTGDEWEYLSIPPGQSSEYNKNPTKEKGLK